MSSESTAVDRWQEDLADDYLYLATEALRESAKGMAGGRSATKRLQLSRQAMLYAAFAAEAYINRFLFEHFTGSDRASLEKLSTVDKYVFVPRLALGSAIFDRGSQPLQRILDLFVRRNALAHPKPRSVMPVKLDMADVTFWNPSFKDYNPLIAVEDIIAVASGARLLDEAIGDPAPSTIHGLVLELSTPLRDLAKIAHKQAQPNAAELAVGRQQALAALLAGLGQDDRASL
jgi:hypothetical protein